MQSCHAEIFIFLCIVWMARVRIPCLVLSVGTRRIYGGGSHVHVSFVGGSPLECVRLLYIYTSIFMMGNVSCATGRVRCNSAAPLQVCILPTYGVIYVDDVLDFVSSKKRRWFSLPLRCFGRIPGLWNRRNESMDPPEDSHKLLIAYRWQNMRGGGCLGDVCLPCPSRCRVGL